MIIMTIESYSLIFYPNSISLENNKGDSVFASIAVYFIYIVQPSVSIFSFVLYNLLGNPYWRHEIVVRGLRNFMTSSGRREQKIFPWHNNSGWELNGIASCILTKKNSKFKHVA